MEILYCMRDAAALPETESDGIRWLEASEHGVFCGHLALCGQEPLALGTWTAAYAAGVRYCGLFKDGKMVARACMERIHSDIWEVADVRVCQGARESGYARRVCAFVAKAIFAQGKWASIRTEAENLPMRRVIDFLGFSEVGPADRGSLDALVGGSDIKML